MAAGPLERRGIMAKRKDIRGIVLNQGESQNPSGRYRYRYTDGEGQAHDVYSWRLRPEDRYRKERNLR